MKFLIMLLEIPFHAILASTQNMKVSKIRKYHSDIFGIHKCQIIQKTSTGKLSGKIHKISKYKKNT